MAENKIWVVTTSGNRKLSDVTKDLTEAGFTAEQVLDEIGCIIGTADEATVERLRAVPGVADVSPDTPIDIGPPDAHVT